MTNKASFLSSKTNISEKQILSTLKLLEDGATIPFISRYRKEMTGGLDEVQVALIRDLNDKWKELEKRKETVITSIDEQGLLSDELRDKILSVTEINDLEDIYLPYKPKRKTKASVAKELGLEPLAKLIMAQNARDLESLVLRFLNENVKDIDQALQGARDIIAEWVSENIAARNKVRRYFSRDAIISSKVVKSKKEEAIKFKDYFEFSEPLKKCASHRFLALMRGQEEGFLKVSISIDDERAVDEIADLFLKADNESADQVLLAIRDAYKRLISPSIENEFVAIQKEKADKEAIMVFSENLRQLLLAPPLGSMRVMGIDPGFQSGCKVVCLDEQGKLLYNETIYPHKPQEKTTEAMKKVRTLSEQYKIDAIAIGNGTASRETENFIKKVSFNKEIKVFIVSEAGASVYSASPIAREEFPQYDVTVRGAVSIGRRLMDPLAELVKIDPKAIGVGQYQHDVNQTELKKSLDTVVESCVNLVGVNLNTASKHLLTYVSGLGTVLAQNIVNYRDENGPFKNRESLKKVPRLGEKAFEQAAGFLRIPESENPLDNTAVHPERYELVKKMAKDLNMEISEMIRNSELKKLVKPEKYISEEVGLPTIQDILEELAKPNRDPRKSLKAFEFAQGIKSINDVQPGMIVPGIITNITNFGAFVDIGVKQDGLVHISQLADKFVSNPMEVVKLHQYVTVKVTEVDIPRKRIQLTMKGIG